MDLNQVKLNKTEWDSIEIPVKEQEMNILKLIIDGYHNIDIRTNHNNSLASYLHMPETKGIDDYLFNEYFKTKIENIDKTLLPIIGDIKIKKSEMMKIKLNKSNDICISNVYENKLITVMESLYKLKNDNRPFHVVYFTLHTLCKNKVHRINQHILNCVDIVLHINEDAVSCKDLVIDAHNVIEKNHMLMQNEDTHLYTHQKDIFRVLQNPNMEEKQEKYKTANLRLKSSKKDMDNAEAEGDQEYYEEAENEYEKTENEINQLNTPSVSRLVLYSAPTGTGKTITPLALSSKFRILFVCAARHVGLALAKSAISIGRKVAFAFGCESGDDIRLHYSAASVFTTNYKTGKIWKVDNSVGDKVEIMICDVKSYLCAMYYMKAFNPIDNLLMYWDEPTIGMDYEEHPLHQHIHKVWKDNLIPNIVLSSATLPNTNDIRDTIEDFESKFSETNTNITTITSYDCKKSIPLIDKNGFSIMPHYISIEDYEKVYISANHCKNNPTLLRYLDLEECVKFIKCVEGSKYVSSRFYIERKFTSFEDITMTNIKMHYITTVLNITSGCWGAVCLNIRALRSPKLLANTSVDNNGSRLKKSNSIGPGYGASTNTVFNTESGKGLSRMTSVGPNNIPHTTNTKDAPGVLITTKDAYTLTDGPTLFLTDDIEKIAKFYLKQSYIPATTLSGIMEKIDFNNNLSERIAEVEEKLETLTEKLDSMRENENNKRDLKPGKGKGKSNTSKKDNKTNISNDEENPGTTLGKLNQERNALYGMIKNIELNEMFVPNKKSHSDRWAKDPESNIGFTSDIESDVVCQIMAIDGVQDTWKILLLMGIGVFANHNSQSYTEIMKRMADQQKLYLIIASSDYIYGTNYQFCHGYLGKDIHLTQQKTIQSLGRIGRNNIQQTYSVRLRDENQANVLLLPSDNNVEIRNMNRLFVSNDE
jgi:hypothetical protein